MGDYFSQTSIIYFCLEFGCCPYYRGILKARADCTYFGRGKREAFKQDMFIWMHLLLSSRGGGGGGGGGSLLWPVQGDSAERPSIFLRLKVF